jgi:O-antigen ligase
VGLLSWDRLEQGLFHRKRWVRLLTIFGFCLAAGLPVGAIIGLAGGVYGSALLLALAIGYGMLRSTLLGLVTLVGVVCLLPFAALPINIGFSPTILDLVLLVVFFTWISRIVTHKEGEFVATIPTLPLLVFVALAVASFILGLSHSRLTSNVVRHFGEILLSVLLFFLVTNLLRTLSDLQVIVLALILAGFLAAVIGIVLYVLPDTMAIRLLSTLRVVRYPTGSGVLRYVEDDPTLPLRAISTSIDPNVLGGMLVFVTTLTATQTLAERPILPRPWLVLILVTMAVCLILTFSRGSLAGLVFALLLLGLLRYPRMLWLGVALALLILVLPVGRDYIRHFVEGVQGQDLATQMRFGEYKDALILISRYPWFGVGFTGTPDIDTYLGVSNVYLLIAEEMGFVGLAAFVTTLLSFLAKFFSMRNVARAGSELEPIMWGTCLAVAGGMAGGMLDHYLFNLDFPHAAALLWLFVGLGAVSMRLLAVEPDLQQGITAQ